MSWAARITTSPSGALRLQFPEPMRLLDMDRSTAKHLGWLLIDASARAVSDPSLRYRGDAPKEYSGDVSPAAALALEARHQVQGVVAGLVESVGVSHARHGGALVNSANSCAPRMGAHMKPLKNKPNGAGQ